MSHKLHVMCLAHNTAEMVEEAIRVTGKTLNGFAPASKTIVDCHWPLEQSQLQTQMLSHIAAKHGWQFVRPLKNRGVAGNWNWIISELGLGTGDVLYGADPDGRPQETGWAEAMLDVFNNAPECYTVQFNRPEIYANKALGAREKEINGRWVLDYPQLISWSLGAFSIEWLNKIGGFTQDSAQYGYCEHSISRHAALLAGRFYMLRDFYDHHLASPSPLYQEWKLASAQKKTESDFGSWVKQKSIFGDFT